MVVSKVIGDERGTIRKLYEENKYVSKGLCKNFKCSILCNVVQWEARLDSKPQGE